MASMNALVTKRSIIVQGTVKLEVVLLNSVTAVDLDQENTLSTSLQDVTGGFAMITNGGIASRNQLMTSFDTTTKTATLQGIANPASGVIAGMAMFFGY